eukprot:2112866-Rhodomonas_salina.1
MHSSGTSSYGCSYLPHKRCMGTGHSQPSACPVTVTVQRGHEGQGVGEHDQPSVLWDSSQEEKQSSSLWPERAHCSLNEAMHH